MIFIVRIIGLRIFVDLRLRKFIVERRNFETSRETNAFVCAALYHGTCEEQGRFPAGGDSASSTKR
jgi:hypothetical protein